MYAKEEEEEEEQFVLLFVVTYFSVLYGRDLLIKRILQIKNNSWRPALHPFCEKSPTLLLLRSSSFSCWQ